MDRRGYAQRIQMQKDANINIIRMIAHQSSPEMYELCDEMGMMIWQEMPLQWGYSRTEAIHQDILDVVRQTIEQTRPTPPWLVGRRGMKVGSPNFPTVITRDDPQSRWHPAHDSCLGTWRIRRSHLSQHD